MALPGACRGCWCPAEQVPEGEGEGEEQEEGPGESKNPGKHGFRNQEVLWKGAGGPSTRVRPAGGGPSGEHPRSQTGVLSIP